MALNPCGPTDSPGGTRRRFLALAGTAAGFALAGCTGDGEPTPEGEGTISIELENRDDEPYEYEVVVQAGDPEEGPGSRSTGTGVIPGGTTIAFGSAFRLTDGEHGYSIDVADGRVNRVWDPVDCPDYAVEAVVEDRQPSADGECRAE